MDLTIGKDIYRNDVDFAVLALQDPNFNKLLKFNGQLDFSNPDAVKQLTKSLLKRDFGITLDLPDDRLCPPVPNRFNYILWVQDLLDTTSDSYSDRYIPDREVIGLDIKFPLMEPKLMGHGRGTGASCIYPLLGCAARRAWKFAATGQSPLADSSSVIMHAETSPEVDQKNVEYAKRNILANNLKSRIRPLKTASDDPLISLGTFGFESIDFTICNPPFYASSAELLASAALKSRPARSACTGAEVEMVTPGGEVAFVARMIEESCMLKDRVQWYTTMLGKLNSVTDVVENLKKKGVGNWAVKEFVQGTKTRRWGVAWSWGDMRPRMDVARGITHLPKHLLPFPSDASITIPGSTVDTAARGVNSIIQRLELQWQYRPQISTGIGFATENVWSRSARRKKHNQDTVMAAQLSKKASIQEVDEEQSDEDEPTLGFKIEIRQGSGENETVVKCRWLKGVDVVLFESFCGMLKRQLNST
ncbi:hypothetical protein MMC13_006771 [Lambiella insularis]|nr:hypothetical protein [Lambiella insularis]